MKTPDQMHPAVAILVVLIGGPILAALFAVGWVLLMIATGIFKVCLWPFRVIGSVVYAVLGGGR